MHAWGHKDLPNVPYPCSSGCWDLSHQLGTNQAPKWIFCKCSVPYLLTFWCKPASSFSCFALARWGLSIAVYRGTNTTHPDLS
eukprot:scaffold82182_cov18-Tisochrysis_lutea.AAC.3